MNTRVEFSSSAFQKYPNENAELVNPNCWGKRLAEFVRDKLPKYGIPTEDILCEDWGWLVNLKHDSFPLWVGCGVMDDSDEEGNNEAAQAPQVCNGIIQHCLFVTAEPGLLQKWFKRIDTQPAVQGVIEGLRQMMREHPEFQDVNWAD